MVTHCMRVAGTTSVDKSDGFLGALIRSQDKDLPVKDFVTQDIGVWGRERWHPGANEAGLFERWRFPRSVLMRATFKLASLFATSRSYPYLRFDEV